MASKIHNLSPAGQSAVKEHYRKLGNQILLISSACLLASALTLYVCVWLPFAAWFYG